MEIDSCEFPEDLHYDLESLTWLRVISPSQVRLGATSLLVGLAGKLIKVKPRPGVKSVERGRSLGTLQSAKYFGPLRTPVSGRVTEFNDEVIRDPKLMNDSPYEDGWFAQLRLASLKGELAALRNVPDATGEIRELRKKLRVRCFKAFPDYEMFEIGVECAAVIVRLNDLLASMRPLEVVHIVSDDQTADIEMQRWSYDTKQEIVETRREGNLFHFIVRKVV